MRSIYRYIPVVDQYTTAHVEIYNHAGEALTERLCEIEGIVYVSVDSGADLSSVDDQFQLQGVTLTDELVASIKAHSPKIKLIDRRRAEMIDNQYSRGARDELVDISEGISLGMIESSPALLARLAAYKVAAMESYKWRDQQYAHLGLVIS